MYYLDLPEPETPTGTETGGVRTNYLWPKEIREKEDRIAIAQFQMQPEENRSQAAKEHAPAVRCPKTAIAIAPPSGRFSIRAPRHA